MANQIAIGALGYGGGIQLTPTGDILVLVDTPDDPAASRQLLVRLILTTPIQYDAFRNPIGPPDDIFNRDFGAGIRTLLGAPLTPALAYEIQSRILASIAASDAFAASPAPTVDVFADGPSGELFVSVTATTVSGQIVVLPSLALQTF